MRLEGVAPARLQGLRFTLSSLSATATRIGAGSLAFGAGTDGAALSYTTPEFLLSAAARAGEVLPFLLSVSSPYESWRDTLKITAGGGADATPPRITFDAPRLPVRAIAGKARTVVVKVRSPRMLATPGALRAIFGVFEANRTSVDVVATSEVSVSVTIDDDQHLDAVVGQLSAFGDVAVERGRGIVALVGAGLGESTATMARALGALGDLRLHMLSLSATGINLTLIVDDDAVHEAMRRLHEAFFGKGAA